MPTVQETFDAMPGKLIKEKAAGITAVYQFELSGEGGGKWFAEVKDCKCSVATGEHPQPSITIRMTAQDYLDMASGKLNGQLAFMTGRLKLKGDMALAIRMNTIFSK
jgi:putative sterol carrier protein